MGKKAQARVTLLVALDRLEQEANEQLGRCAQAEYTHGVKVWTEQLHKVANARKYLDKLSNAILHNLTEDWFDK